MLSLLLLAFSTLLSLLFSTWLEIVLLPHLLHVIVKLFLCYLKRLAQILQYFSMIILFSPIGRIEPVAVADGRLDSRSHEKFCDLCAALSCCDMQSRESWLILYCWVPTILHEHLTGIVKILFYCSVERCIFADLSILLFVGIGTILEEKLNQGHILSHHCILKILFILWTYM